MSPLILCMHSEVTEQGLRDYGAIPPSPSTLASPNCILSLLLNFLCVCFCIVHQLLPSSAHHECEVDKIEMQASPAYTSVAMTTPMGPQCEDGAPPKYMNVNI